MNWSEWFFTDFEVCTKQPLIGIEIERVEKLSGYVSFSTSA